MKIGILIWNAGNAYGIRIINIFYDSSNRVTAKIFADGTRNTWQYDSAGRLSKRTDARGITATYAYDAFHNLNTVSYSDGTPSVTYTYDSYNRVTTVADALGTSKYTYDANSRRKTIDGPWDNDTLTYAYDNLGRVTSVTPESGQAVTKVFDDLSRISRIQTGAGDFSYSYKSDVSPMLQKLAQPGGAYTDYAYDSLNRLTSIANKTSANAEITKNSFGYNNLDVIGTETVSSSDAMAGFQAGLTKYNYNNVNQLLNSANPDQVFTYDQAGNMTKGYTPEGYVYTAAYDAVNRLKSISYTDSANVIHKTELVYGADNFLGLIRQYDANVKTSETRIVRDGALAFQERDQNNAILKEYVWGPNLGGGIGGLLSMKSQGQSYNYLYDGRGNVSAVIDSSQNVAASYRYDTFGKLMVKSGTLNQPFQFSTKRYFAGVGLNDYGYRFYSPSVGRWLTRDPIAERGGVNLYGFVGNSPVSYADPDGLIANVIGGSIGSKVVGFDWTDFLKI